MVLICIFIIYIFKNYMNIEICFLNIKNNLRSTLNIYVYEIYISKYFIHSFIV